MKKTLIIALLYSLVLPLSAQTAFNFIGIENNTAVAGMAGAGMAQSQLAYGTFANPALMTQFGTRNELSFNYQYYAPKLDLTHMISAAYGHRTERFAISFAGTYLVERPYDLVVNSAGMTVGSYTPKELQAGAALAFRIIDCLSVGANARVLYSNFAEDAKYFGFASNVFLAFHKDIFTVTAGARNLGPKLKKQYALPSSATVAAAVNAAKLGPCGLLADVDFDYYFNGGISVNAGGQFSVKDILYLRGGYHFATSKAPVPSYASVGLSLGNKVFKVNASYMFASEVLANTFSAGLSFTF